MERILVINPFGIGDVLFTTPVISAIKDNYPDSFIGYWCNERVKEILQNNPSIDIIFALSRGDIKKLYRKSKCKGIISSLSLYHKIKKEKFSVSLDFSLDHRYSLLSKLWGIKRRVGFNYKDRGRFLTDKIDIEGYSEKHAVEYYLDLLKFLNLRPKSYNLSLTVPQKNNLKAKMMLAQAGVNDQDLVIAIAPGAGASWGKDASLKHWPAVNFATLIDKIIDDYRAKILILGDDSERPIADTIIKTAHYNVVDLVGKTTLEELIAVINNVEMLITNDGGSLHIAVALGKKTVSFFGPVDPKVYGPYPSDEKRHVVLRRALECSPCYSQFRLSTCQRNRECLKRIDVAQALTAVSSLLSEKENI